MTTPSNSGIFRLSTVDDTGKGAKRLAALSIKAILAMFDPIALPMAIAELPLLADMNAIRISGAEVPTLMIVKPITSVDMSNRCAIELDPSTNLSALRASNPRLTIMAKITGQD